MHFIFSEHPSSTNFTVFFFASVKTKTWLDAWLNELLIEWNDLFSKKKTCIISLAQYMFKSLFLHLLKIIVKKWNVINRILNCVSMM